MDWIVVEGVKPYDGRYEFDMDGRPFTTREWGWIKRLSGYLPLTIAEGFDGADPELFTAFAVIAMRRADKITPREVPDVFERIADAPFDVAIKLETDAASESDEGDDASPPPPSSPAKTSASGTPLRTNSGRSDEPQKRFGPPGLVTSESSPQKWAS